MVHVAYKYIPGKGVVKLEKISGLSSSYRELSLLVRPLFNIIRHDNLLSPEVYQTLLERMKVEKQLHPITLRWGRVLLLDDGHHRLFAADALRWERINVRVENTISDKVLIALGVLEENL